MSYFRDKTAFPWEQNQGMTYRQWLIGMGLANGQGAGMAISTADEVIRYLEQERESNRSNDAEISDRGEG